MGKQSKNNKKKKVYAKFKGHCAYCGVHRPFDEMTLDHIIPKNKSGSGHEDNLFPACEPCNSLKTDISIEALRIKVIKMNDLTYPSYANGVKNGLIDVSQNPQTVTFYFERFMSVDDVMAQIEMSTVKIAEHIQQKLYCRYEGHCAYCGVSISFNDMVSEYIKPLSKGGKKIVENMNPACKSCSDMRAELSIKNFKNLIMLSPDSLSYKNAFENGLIGEEFTCYFQLPKMERLAKSMGLPLNDIQSIQTLREFCESKPNRIYKRYGGLCSYCGIRTSFEEMRITHGFPVSKGGKDTIANIFPACPLCGETKGELDIKEFRALIKRSPDSDIYDKYVNANLVKRKSIKFFWELPKTKRLKKIIPCGNGEPLPQGELELILL
ncbi:MAG: HNH endonuclease [Oscillospiraceae bacterium]|nr:HNH endonuclease [Oscillospiraceae bacterium]